ncbi:CAP domain-containing protein [Kribbella sp. NBC_01245]|uniref:CAP domain-containing protein n=1 Tax=Kribbella sp. NBC_01245 TaxID=2903578 RepID=UPI002E2B0F94|nr:CAP domain-containing protein [Kribbella sp. NBC_01245]
MTNPPNRPSDPHPFTPPSSGHSPFASGPSDPSDPSGPRRRWLAPIVGIGATVAVLAGITWIASRNDTSPSSQDSPLVVSTDAPTTDPDNAGGSDPTAPGDDSTGTPTMTPTKATPTPRPTPTKARATTPKPTRTPSTRPATRPPTSRPTTRPTTPPTTKPTPRPTTPKPTVPPAAPGTKEQQVLTLTNRERAKAGCGPLRMNTALFRAAEGHARDMVAKNYFSHTSADGRSPWDRMKQAGYSGGAMAENIAAGQTTAAAVVEAWMNSEGHRANIENCTYKLLGVGHHSNHWVQNFGG